MKVLFLDIDGVVNCDKTYTAGVLFPLDAYMAFLVGKIQLDTGCEVVLSSAWRHMPEGIAEVEKRVVKLLDRTPNVPGGFRGDEINAWLKEHPEVNKYAILDDDTDFYPDQPHFRTFWNEGLTPEIAKQVTEHLNS